MATQVFLDPNYKQGLPIVELDSPELSESGRITISLSRLYHLDGTIYPPIELGGTAVLGRDYRINGQKSDSKVVYQYPSGYYTTQYEQNIRQIRLLSGYVSGSIQLMPLSPGSLNGKTITAKVLADPLRYTIGHRGYSSLAVPGSIVDTEAPKVLELLINGTTLTLTLNEEVKNVSPEASSFRVVIDGSARKVTSASIDTTNKTIILQLDSGANNGQPVTLDYGDKSTDNDTSGAIEDLAGNKLESFSSAAVTNVTPPPTISLTVSASSVAEDGNSNLTYTFTRSGSTAKALAFRFTVDGTARKKGNTADPADYYSGFSASSVKQTFYFEAGSPTLSVDVNPTADTRIEDDETVIITLIPATNDIDSYIVGTPDPVVGIITDDDRPSSSVTGAPSIVSLSVSPDSVGEDSDSNITYIFSRSGSTANALTVNYTVGGTARLVGTSTDPADYNIVDSSSTTSTRTISIDAGSATATVVVDPTADTRVESDETVILTLAVGTGYTIGTPEDVSGTILDKVFNPPTGLKISPSAFDENIIAGAAIGTLTSTDPDIADSFTYSLVNGTGDDDNSAFTIDGDKIKINASPDYETKSSYSIRVRSTDSRGLFYEDDLILGVNNFTASTEVRLQALVDKASEDGKPVSYPPYYEYSNLYFRLLRTGAANLPLTIEFQLSGDAVPGADYTASVGRALNYQDIVLPKAYQTGSFEFPKGLNEAYIKIRIKPDSEPERDEEVILTIIPSVAYEVTGPSSMVATILNDDSELAKLSITSSATVAAENGEDNLIFTVTRTGDLTKEVTFNYLLGGTAANGIDYTIAGASNNSYTQSSSFKQGEATATITIEPIDDNVQEQSETVEIELQNGGDYYVDSTKYKQIGTILNHDKVVPTVSVTVSPLGIDENGDLSLIYTFQRDTSGKDLQVLYTLSGTATPGIDYSGVALPEAIKSVVIPQGVFQARLYFDPIDDLDIEGDKDVTVSILDSDEYNIKDPHATGVIRSDDLDLPKINLSASISSVYEDSGNEIHFVFKPSRSLSRPTEVFFEISGTADINQDYLLGIEEPSKRSSVMLGPGNSPSTLIVKPKQDFQQESDENIQVSLVEGYGYYVGDDNLSKAVILDDDSLSHLHVPGIAIGNSGDQSENSGKEIIFTFYRNGSIEVPLEVGYTINGTSSYGEDYFSLANPGSVHVVRFMPGETKVSAKLSIHDDVQVEDDESIILSISPSSQYAILSGQGVTEAFILDDDRLMISANTAPTDLRLSASSFDENIPAGTAVGSLISAAADFDDIFTYSLVNGAGSTDNAAFTIDGNQLKINASPDYETKSSYKIRLRSTDKGRLYFEKAFTINVLDVDESPNTGTTTPTAPITQSTMDFTGDGEVDETDALLMMRHMIGTFPGDAITQGITGVANVNGLRDKIMKTMEESSALGGGGRLDIDGDGFINPFSDGMMILKHIHGKGEETPGGLPEIPDFIKNPMRDMSQMQNHLKDLIGF